MGVSVRNRYAHFQVDNSQETVGKVRGGDLAREEEARTISAG